MMRETEIGLAAAEAVGSKYDEACKSLFQNREIIAPVLKEVVPEYQNSALEEIIQYIDADSIEDLPVDDVSAQVAQLPTEMYSQNNYIPTNLSSPIVKRGIYYVAREISSQLGILMEKTYWRHLSAI